MQQTYSWMIYNDTMIGSVIYDIPRLILEKRYSVLLGFYNVVWLYVKRRRYYKNCETSSSHFAIQKKTTQRQIAITSPNFTTILTKITWYTKEVQSDVNLLRTTYISLLVWLIISISRILEKKKTLVAVVEQCCIFRFLGFVFNFMFLSKGNFDTRYKKRIGQSFWNKRIFSIQVCGKFCFSQAGFQCNGR